MFNILISKAETAPIYQQTMEKVLEATVDVSSEMLLRADLEQEMIGGSVILILVMIMEEL